MTMTLVELAEECLKNSLLRHEERRNPFDVAQRRFEQVLIYFEEGEDETDNA